MTFHGIHTVELPEKRNTKPIDVMQLVNCYFLNEKLRFSCMHFRGFSGTYNMHESTFFSRTCVCVLGGGGGPINLSTKIEQTRIRIMYHNVALNDWCEKIIGELFYCKLQIVI